MKAAKRQDARTRIEPHALNLLVPLLDMSGPCAGYEAARAAGQRLAELDEDTATPLASLEYSWRLCIRPIRALCRSICFASRARVPELNP